MQKIVTKRIQEFDEQAALVVSQMIQSSDKKIVVAFPTGNTPAGMYQELRKKKIDWNNVMIFMLDVNYPQDPNDVTSFYRYMTNHLPGVDFAILDSQTKEPEKECASYEMKIKNAGGLDLVVLGIGHNGHIAYNEPGTSFDSVTHMAKLQNQPFEYGLTMGIQTIMSAKKIILLAKGQSKAEVVKQALNGPVDISCPASILQTHTDVTFILDQEAASVMTEV